MKEYLKNLFRVFREPSMLTNRFWRDDVILPITTWFNPRQKWLTRIIPNRWCDKPELIQLVLFETLIDFVENEKGLSQLDIDWKKELEDKHVSQEYVDNVFKVYTELRDVYNYIKNERRTFEESLDWKVERELDRRDLEAMTTIVKYSGYLWT
jgi:hypothetical protein